MCKIGLLFNPTFLIRLIYSQAIFIVLYQKGKNKEKRKRGNGPLIHISNFPPVKALQRFFDSTHRLASASFFFTRYNTARSREPARTA